MSRSSRKRRDRDDDEDDDGLDSARLDVWLWRARFFKTRSLATTFVEGGKVRVTRHEQILRGRKPAFPVAVGDVLAFARAGRLVCVRVEAIPLRRGPASEAQGLYRTVDLGDTSLENAPRDRG